ncbi:uncharacterized protein LOC107618449 isoform X1 [Arachis ipaensis]|nr:uncharacterized protein LOC107618449 isoform X1 [Arachis ipaensis]XP_020978122.1 uncharacterized protein LOC107618449 isoform X1 [Arachis ipaensis]XP_025628975.1 uncharacterized protein LOC112722210 isoform X1 [Arachis hypogaea]
MIHFCVHAILQWNKRMNLTAVKDADEVMERHIEDSLAILPPLRDCYRTRCSGAPSHERLSLVDVGTGADIPGVVLAIACPEWEVTLMESISKSCVFLEHVVEIIGSSNIQIVQFHPDVSTTMVVKPGPVLDFLCENQNVKHPNLINWTKAKRVLKNFKIKANNIEYKISGLSDNPCKTQKIEHDTKFQCVTIWSSWK